VGLSGTSAVSPGAGGAAGAGMTVAVLGCSGSYADRDCACSGYLVRAGATAVWLDAGNGTLAHLQRHIALDDLDAVVLSHEHPDHWADLEGLHVWARYRADRRGLPVYAPAGLKKVTYHEDMSPWLVWHDVADGDRVEVGGLVVTFSRTDHGPETLAARVEGGGRVLGYSADSGPGWSLEALGPGIDLALCEATFLSELEGAVSGHMSARQAGATGAAAGVGRLVLTHVWPGTDLAAVSREGAEAFGAPVTVARQHDVYEV
jgi:ribonuclease BN (tRNA processing enzyme)